MVVKGFRFVGNTRISGAELTAAVKEYLNRPLDFAGLEAAAAAVAEVYRKAGWVVRAYLPEQDIVDGIVTIHIVEAVFGGTRLEGPPPSRVDVERVRATIDHALAQGDLVNIERLDRPLLLLGDLPGLSAQGVLRQGKNENETELVVRTEDRPIYNGTAAFDNFGAYSTGYARANGNVFLNSPFRFGDQAVVSAIASLGNQYGRLGWSMPVGYDGWRVGVSASYLRYNLISSNFKDLHASGSSSTEGLNANWPIIRTRTANLYLGFNYDHRAFDNKSLYVTVSNYDIHALSAGLSGNLFDELGGSRGVNTATLTFSYGLVGSGHPDFGDAAPNSSVRYSKLRYSLSREQQITDDVSAYVAVAGQLSSRNLDSSEKIYPGGPDGVRAYPIDEAGGSQGEIVNFELRWKLPYNFSVAAVYDWSHLDVNHSQTAAPQPNSYNLSSAGLTLAWQADFGLVVRTMWAYRLGRAPDPTANGGDQGGARLHNRFWLSATQPF